MDVDCGRRRSRPAAAWNITLNPRSCRSRLVRERRRFRESLRRTRRTAASVAPQSRAALAATASITGWTSVGELEITRRISPVAVCCSRASSARGCAISILNSRTFSMAMTAWSAKVSSERDLLVGERSHVRRLSVDYADGLVLPQHGARPGRVRSMPTASPELSYSGSLRDVGHVNDGARRGPLDRRSCSAPGRPGIPAAATSHARATPP